MISPYIEYFVNGSNEPGMQNKTGNRVILNGKNGKNEINVVEGFGNMQINALGYNYIMYLLIGACFLLFLFVLKPKIFKMGYRKCKRIKTFR